MIYKRGRIYWYRFQWLGNLIRKSTKQGNDKVARQMEAAHRTALAKGLVGIRERKPAPTLSEFSRERFLLWARATFEHSSPKSWAWYRVGTRALTSYRALAERRLSEITGEQVADFAVFRLTSGLQISTINSSLRVLRRMLRLAVEWGSLESAPKIKLLPGERHRERVVTAAEEARYLSAAPDLLASVGIVLVDTGMRPEECFRLR